MGAEVLAISTDDLSGAQSIVERVGIEFPVLYNSDTDVVDAYGVYNLRGDSLAAPATFVIDTEGLVRWSYVSSRTSDRPQTSEIIAQLQNLSE